MAYVRWKPTKKRRNSGHVYDTQRKQWGSYWAGYRDSEGRAVQVRAVGMARKEAQRWADELELKSRRVRTGLEEGVDQELLFEQLAKRWKRARNPDMASTPVQFARLARYLLPVLGSRRVALIRPADIQGLVNELAVATEERPSLAPQTREHIRLLCSLIFDFAIDNGWARKNPAIGWKTTIPLPMVRYLSADEASLVIAHAEEALRGLFAVALYTGMRKGEICGLLAESVHLESRVIIVDRSYGKRTKSNKRRLVPIPDELVPYLKTELGRVRSAWLFPDSKGRMRTRMFNLAAKTRQALCRAGLILGYEHMCRRKGCGFHERRADDARSKCPKCSFTLWIEPVPRDFAFKDLRSTHATIAYAATGDIRHVQETLGHATPEFTAKRYSFALPEHRLAQANRLTLKSVDPALSREGANSEEEAK